MTPREILSGPEKWCQRVYALDERGHSVLPEDPRMAKTCLLGSCRAAVKGGDLYPLSRQIFKAIHKLFPEKECTIMVFNDSATWEMVDAVLNEAFPK